MSHSPSTQVERVEKTIIKTGGFARFLATLFFGVLIGIAIGALFNFWLEKQKEEHMYEQLQQQLEELQMQMQQKEGQQMMEK